ncbi:hypothetical protein QVD17_16910 [Tagetes erecta]|uniref:Uncharacterized protein n=1 Tax=Tagetes erecta TaxID=13708 RepID=A0AAD8KXE8_TARER|nr:hypothetical protein QVD17_16910 [Tagetes erecta]
MLTLQSPVTGNHLARPKPARRPLQPLKSPPNVPHSPTHNTYCIQILQDANKENPNQNRNKNGKTEDTVQIEQFEVSLADELTAMREKMERLKADKEKTEKMLKQRELVMEMKMKELDQRGEVQKMLEIEVDRLYRLNELKSLCNRIMPIRSLRDKEQGKIKPDKSQVEETEEEKSQDLLLK